MLKGISMKKLRRLYRWVVDTDPVYESEDCEEDGVTYYFVCRYRGNPRPPSEEEVRANGVKTHNFLELIQRAFSEFEHRSLPEFIVEAVRSDVLLPSIHYIPGDHDGNCRSAYEYFNGFELENSNTEYFFGFTEEPEVGPDPSDYRCSDQEGGKTA